jgi:L-lactate dehydrogenase complex protein LldG
MTETNSKLSAKKNEDARDVILASIRTSLSASVPFDAEHRKHHGHTENRAEIEPIIRAPLSRETLIDNFKKNFESVGGNYSVVSNSSEAANHVRKIMEKIGAKHIAISDSELVDRVVGIGPGIECVKNASAKTLFECDLGITSAQWAIAETGTLVLESELERHRLTSLVPPVHLCLLKADNIRQTLGEILELTSRELSRTVTFITGASRTSDIELTLAIGVHGPAELHVIVIVDQ